MLSRICDSLPKAANVERFMRSGIVGTSRVRKFCTEAVKKWDWLRADVGVEQGFRVAARCPSQFFHSRTGF